MTDKEKFYKLALNVINFEPKEVIYYNGKPVHFKIYLDDDEEFNLEFRVEDRQLWLNLNIFHGYLFSETFTRDTDKIIRVLKENKVGKLLLEGIE